MAATASLTAVATTDSVVMPLILTAGDGDASAAGEARRARIKLVWVRMSSLVFRNNSACCSSYAWRKQQLGVGVVIFFFRWHRSALRCSVGSGHNNDAKMQQAHPHPHTPPTHAHTPACMLADVAARGCAPPPTREGVAPAVWRAPKTPPPANDE